MTVPVFFFFVFQRCMVGVLKSVIERRSMVHFNLYH